MSRTRKNMRRYPAILMAAAVMAVFLHSNVAAQGYDNETVRGAIERTAQIISEARSIIEESRSSMARLSLERAISLQEKASNFFTAERAQFAYKYTMEAREEARHAIALARQEARIEDKLVNMTENTSERLMRLREQVMESGIRDERLNRLMMEAREQLEKANTNAQQLKNRLAMNFAESARKLSMQAEKRFRGLLSDQEMIQRRLALMENLARRARERMAKGESSADSGILQQAEEQLARARTMAG
ncbi:MAG TPA: hypothetical protein VLA34_13890, partial [Candidatus Krumholzibacterium sp.]|nr:hypothetical protein [Candidatus Krumholzibacterium sp.]